MVNLSHKTIEVCFSPALYHKHHQAESIVIIVDILRATTSIITAFMNGANKLIPVTTVDQAKALKDKGYIVAAERDGIVRDFADFGNCPFNFTEDLIKGKDVAYSTTNGTQAINMAQDAHKVAIGAYINISAIAHWLINEQRNVVIFCAGWKDRFNLEDTIFAGALCEKLLQSQSFTTNCDSTLASLDLWSLAKKNLLEYIKKSAQHHRLKKNGLDQCLTYCHTMDLTNLIPVLKNNCLIIANDQPMAEKSIIC